MDFPGIHPTYDLEILNQNSYFESYCPKNNHGNHRVNSGIIHKIPLIIISVNYILKMEILKISWNQAYL